MSFARDIELNNKNTQKNHLPTNQVSEVHTHGTNGMKASHALALPPMNIFGGIIRSKPQSGFNQANLISGRGQLDYHLNSAGYCEKLALEIELTCAVAVSVIPHYLIDRIELYSTEGNIISTIYGDCVYGNKINQGLEIFNRIKDIENLDSNYNAKALVAATPYRFVVHLPTFIDGSQLKLSAVKDQLKIKIWFSDLGVVAGNATDISVSLCDILQYTQQLGAPLEAMEQKRKSMGNFYFRFLNPVRIASNTMAMTAGSQYDVRLSSANSLSAYLFFVIRASPLTTNINTFVQIDSYELLDKDNTIVGLKQTNESHKFMSLRFEGDIFNYKNIYTIPFALNTESAMNGSQVGFYAFTSNEILRIYTGAAFANGNYRIDVYSMDYNMLCLKDGALNVSK
jgi:hypothetical protein